MPCTMIAAAAQCLKKDESGMYNARRVVFAYAQAPRLDGHTSSRGGRSSCYIRADRVVLPGKLQCAYEYVHQLRTLLT